jgi:hypothetical protein
VGQRETIGSVIRGNLGTLWGRYRQTQGLSAEETKAIGAERQEFGRQIMAGLEDVHAPTEIIIRELRRIFREIEQQPFSLKMPEPAEIVGRLRATLEGEREVVDCVACKALGSSPGVFADTRGGAIQRGVVRVGSSASATWWCFGCYEVFSWYTNRQDRFEEGRGWPYPPPSSMLPKASYPRPAGECGAYTDGQFVTPLAAYVREFVESWLGRAIVDAPCLTQGT